MIDKKFLLLFISLFVSSITSAQVYDSTDLQDINVRCIGPAGMSGRVTCIDVVRSNPEHIFIGTASGGVWESKNGGISWTPIFDDQPTLSIGALAIDPNNADVIWVGTGEGNPRNSHNSGKGIFKSIDGGRTWKCMGLEGTKTIHRILIDPSRPDIIYVGATGSAWGPSKERGLFKSTDGGENWSKILYNNPNSGVADMVMDPSNPNKLLVAMWDHERKPWTFRSGGPGSGLYITYDGGESFKELGKKEGLPKGKLGRIGLAFAQSNPEIVYALIEAKENALYKSDDGGHSWKKVGTKNIGNRPFYYSDIFVDPSNENRIFSLWSYVSKSEDGGKTFQTIMDYSNSIHPDHHAFYIHPDNSKFMLNGNDGGLNISRDGGQTWQFAANIPVGQFYHVAIDTAFPYNVYGGLQDNGSWVGPSAVLRRGGIRNYDWQEIYFGDGFDVLPILGDDRHGYAMSQGGNLARYDRLTGRTTYIKPLHEDGIDLRFNWNAALAADPFHQDGLYYGSQMVHYSPDRGRSWVALSGDLTTNDSTKQQQDKSGGLTVDATQAENHTTLLCITPDPYDSLVIWAGSDDGKLHVTKDRGGSWSEVSALMPSFPKGGWIPQIVPGNKKGEYYVVVNDYRRNNWSAYTYRTDNYGASFQRIVDDTDVEGFVCSIIPDPIDPNLLFLGTDAGLYFSQDGGNSWKLWHKNMPRVQIRDLKIHPTENDLVIGTFGRSIWVIDDISFLRNSIPVDSQEFRVLTTAPGYLVSTKSYSGIRFSAQGEFIGDNTGYGSVPITYYFSKKKKLKTDNKTENKKEKRKRKRKKNEAIDSSDTKVDKDKTGKKKDQKLHVVVFDDNGDSLRYFSKKVNKGFQKIYWDLRRNGISYPSYKERDKKSDPPRGMRVAPGEYLASVRYDEQVDTLKLRVLSDPRDSFSLEHYNDQQEVVDSYYEIVERINSSFKKLSRIKKNLNGLKGTWQVLPDSLRDTLNSLSKPLIERIDSIQGRIVKQPGQKGIPERTQYLLSEIYRAGSYVRGENKEYGNNVKLALDRLSKKSAPLLELMEDFVEKDWKEFQQAYMELEIPIFIPDPEE